MERALHYHRLHWKYGRYLYIHFSPQLHFRRLLFKEACRWFGSRLAPLTPSLSPLTPCVTLHLIIGSGSGSYLDHLCNVGIYGCMVFIGSIIFRFFIYADGAWIHKTTNQYAICLHVWMRHSEDLSQIKLQALPLQKINNKKLLIFWFFAGQLTKNIPISAANVAPSAVWLPGPGYK